MKKNIIVGVSLFIFLILLMVPHISGFEYKKMEEVRHIQFQDFFDNMKKKINDESKVDNISNFKLNASFFKSLSFINMRGIFNDSDGPNKGGFDDITDFIYLLLFIITLPLHPIIIPIQTTARGFLGMALFIIYISHVYYFFYILFTFDYPYIQAPDFEDLFPIISELNDIVYPIAQFFRDNPLIFYLLFDCFSVFEAEMMDESDFDDGR